jgi:hypothetical protein
MNVSPAPFRLERTLIGMHRMSGLVHDRFGKLRREFTGLMVGEMQGATFVMNEELRYGDGQVEHRTWRLTPDGARGYRGETSDSVGAVTGICAGRAVTLSYKLRLPLFGAPRKVAFEDSMYLQPDGQILDRAVLRLWGLHIATVTAIIAPAGSRAGFSASFAEHAAGEGEVETVR